MGAVLSLPERDTRHSIIDTAERFFRDIGYQKTTVADIARSLRMSPANVYRFFDSKKAINEAVLERYKGEQEEALARVAAGPGRAGERLKAMLMASHKLNEARFADQQRMQEMVCAAMEESWDALLSHIARLDALMAGVVAEGVASGEFREMEPGAATRCIQTAMLRFHHPLLINQCARIPGPTAEELIDFVLLALRTAQPA